MTSFQVGRHDSLERPHWDSMLGQMETGLLGHREVAAAELSELEAG
jgi:hypothetical protein